MKGKLKCCPVTRGKSCLKREAWVQAEAASSNAAAGSADSELERCVRDYNPVQLEEYQEASSSSSACWKTNVFAAVQGLCDLEEALVRGRHCLPG